MAFDKRWRLVCYDVRDPKRYRKVFKVLRGVGHSIQYSIFRARLDAREVERLRWELIKVMSPEDRLLIVDLCPSCASNVIARNHVAGWEEEEPTYRVIPAPTNDHASAPVVADAQRTSAKAVKRKAKCSD